MGSLKRWPGGALCGDRECGRASRGDSRGVRCPGRASPQRIVVTGDFFESLVERTDRVIALHSADVDAALVQFRIVCRRTGKSIYHWQDGRGFRSLKAADISVPGSRQLSEALRYVLQSVHYGIYVFTEFERHLHHSSIQFLREIAHAQDGYERKVILLGSEVALPGVLTDSVAHVFEDERKPLKPRLRDGRWVV